MTSLTCHRVGRLIDARAHGLDEAQRLVLEAHLAECGQCREHAGWLDAVTQAAEHGEQPTLSTTRRSRSITGALQSGASRPQVSRARSSSMPVVAAAAVLLVAGGGLWSLRVGGPEAPARAPAQPVASVQPPASPSTETELTADTWVETQNPRTLRLAHATVTAAEGTRMRWRAAEHRVELAHGRVEVDVQPGTGEHFGVRTARFEVEVLGTQFTVTPSSVAVVEGTVSVFVPGRSTRLQLGAGERWAYPPDPAPAPSGGREPAVFLRRARLALADGDVRAARQHLRRVAELGGSRQLRAEAGTLRAECEVAAGDRKAAHAAYERVYRRFGELPAGQNALFASARLAARAGDPTRAHRLFEQYLERYPEGRFAHEAAARLEP